MYLKMIFVTIDNVIISVIFEKHCFKNKLVNQKKNCEQGSSILKAKKWNVKLKFKFIKTITVVESNFSLLKTQVILWPQQTKQEFKSFEIFPSHKTFEQK